MKKINKNRLIFSLLLGLSLGIYFFYSQYSDHQNLEKNGIIKPLYVKSLKDNEVTFFQKAKYTSVAKTYFKIDDKDSIVTVQKNIWALEVDVFKDFNFYLVLDSVIYAKNKPQEFQLLSNFKNYSIVYSIGMGLIFGSIFMIVWIYLALTILNKIIPIITDKIGLKKYKNSN